MKKIMSKDMLGEYHRDFMRISVFLIGKARILERECNCWYLQGFHFELRDRISQRLAIVQSDINPDDSYDYLEIHKSAVFIINCSTIDLSHAYSIPPIPSSTLSRSSPPQTTPVVKTENPDTDVLLQIQSQLSALAQVFASSTAQPMPPSATTQSPTSSIGFCLFCGGSASEHFMRNCPIAEQYIRDGRCKRNSDGRITLPNGNDIPRGLRGRWLQERLDSYFEVFGGLPNRATSPHVTTDLYEAFPDTEIMYAEVVEVEEDPNIARIAFL